MPDTFRFPTPLGAMEVALGPAGEVVRLEFAAAPGAAADGSAEREPDAAPEACRAVVRQVGEYFAGERRTFDLALDPSGSDFELAVWEALVEVPYGQTVGYGALAARIGRPEASRAVGRANGANPIAIVVPCHRALGANGALTGYAGGIERKRALLALEGSLPSDLFG